MTKKELKNILDEGWLERRQKIKNKNSKHSQQCKEWKLREVKILNGELPAPTERHSDYISLPKQSR